MTKKKKRKLKKALIRCLVELKKLTIKVPPKYWNKHF